MIIKKYEIELHQLEYNDIELVRIQRNKESIRSKMLYQSIITPEQQDKWFETINNANSFYFIIHYDGKKIGLAHSKNIDWKKKEDEGGIFIWDENYWNTGIAAKSSILMMQLCFEVIELQKTFAKVHKKNSDAKHFNLSIGYTQTEIENQMVLTRETYKQNIARLRWIASLGKDLTPLSLNDIKTKDTIKIKNFLNKYPPFLRKKLISII